MTYSKKIITIGLFIPVLSLILLTAYRQFKLETGKEVILPISGYDPRDLLAGHYLRFTINYDLPNTTCEGHTYTKKIAYICLAPKIFSYEKPENCTTLIKGFCQYNRFYAGIERYYIPEKHAKYYEGLLRDNKDSSSVVLSVTTSGDTLVKDLLVNGKSITNGPLPDLRKNPD